MERLLKSLLAAPRAASASTPPVKKASSQAQIDEATGTLAPESVVHARLLSPLDSGTMPQGTMVEAVLTEPLCSADHPLVLPEGTRLTGAVVLAQRARFFHRGGQLRFGFQ